MMLLAMHLAPLLTGANLSPVSPVDNSRDSASSHSCRVDSVQTAGATGAKVQEPSIHQGLQPMKYRGQSGDKAGTVLYSEIDGTLSLSLYYPGPAAFLSTIPHPDGFMRTYPETSARRASLWRSPGRAAGARTVTAFFTQQVMGCWTRKA